MMCRTCGACAEADEFADDGRCWGCVGIRTIPASEWAELSKAERRRMRRDMPNLRVVGEDGRTMDAPSHPDSSNYG